MEASSSAEADFDFIYDSDEDMTTEASPSIDMDDVSFDVYDFISLLLCKMLKGTSDKLKHPAFNMILTDEDAIETLLADVEFDPKLAEAMLRDTPPTLAWFKSLPKYEKGNHVWAVYVLVLERKHHRPKIYVGVSTKATTGVQSRFNDYDNGKKFGSLVQVAIDDGYKLTHKALLCWSAIPSAGAVYPLATLFKALEALFTAFFNAVKSQALLYGLPLLCPWNVDALEYDRTCSHSALTEGIRGALDGLTPAQIKEKEVILEEHRRAVQKALSDSGYMAKKGREYYARNKAEGRSEWFAVLRARNMKSRTKAKAEKRFMCKTCGVVKDCNLHLQIHYNTPRHKQRVAGTLIQFSNADWSGRREHARAMKTHHCKPCGYSFHDRYTLDQHCTTQKHKDIVAGVPIKEEYIQEAARRQAIVDNKTFHCTICDHTASSRGSLLNNHFKSETHFEKCEAAGITGEAFVMEWLAAEADNAAPQESVSKKFPCHTCGLGFGWLSHLDKHNGTARHKLAVETAAARAEGRLPDELKKSSLKCDDCDQTFTTKNAFNKHMASQPHYLAVAAAGGVVHESLFALFEDKHLEGKFVCKSCHKSFTNKSNFKKHNETPIHATMLVVGQAVARALAATRVAA